MTDQPQGVDLRFSSFADKGAYKPPNPTQLLGKKDAKRQRFAPGGDWGNDTEETQAEPVKPQPVKQEKQVVVDLLDDVEDVKPKEEKPGSKFAFIKKANKSEQTGSMGNGGGESMLIDFDTIRSEKQ